MTSESLLLLLPNATFEERAFLEQILQGKSEEEKKKFWNHYISMRKDPQQILIFTLLGLIGIAGVQRIMLDQLLMGLLYFFTGGLCMIGTIIDLVRYKDLTLNYNKGVALQVMKYLPTETVS